LPNQALGLVQFPLVALFFAVTAEPKHTGVVWSLDVNSALGTMDHDKVVELIDMETFDGHALERSLQNLPSPVLPLTTSHVSPRVAGQHSYFTMHAFEDPNLAMTNALAAKVEVPAEAKSRLCVELNKLGINHATLFPDLGGLATQLSWQRVGWRFRATPSESEE